MNKWKNESLEEFATRVLITSIAESRGLKYDPKQGLRDSKTGHFITDQPNVIAKTLLGQMSSDKDLATTESILTVIGKLYNYEKLIEMARPILEQHEFPLPEQQKIESHQTGTVEWFRKMIGMCE
jgi:hypothetical protein